MIAHYEEGEKNHLCQFMRDGATLLIKDKHQACGMQFADNQSRHDNATSLSFRKPVSHEADKVVQLAEEVCQGCFELNFQDMFLSSVQDLAASVTSKELKVEKVECDMHQCGEVGPSAVEELTRSLNKVNLIIFSVVCVFNN